MHRSVGLVAVIAALACIASTIVVRAQSPVAIRRLVVTVVTRSDQGRVFCALWRGERGYPTERERAIGQALDRSIQRRRAHCAFADLRPGADYAVAAFHDENGNNELDRNLFGIPSEGTGASNDARGTMGPPSYADARFVFPQAAEHRMTIRIAY